MSDGDLKALAWWGICLIAASIASALSGDHLASAMWMVAATILVHAIVMGDK